MTDLITPGLVALDVDLGRSKEAVIRAMANRIGVTGRADGKGLEADVLAREATSPTGMGDGIAIPHCRSTAVHKNTLAFARLKPPVDFDGPDGPADLCFMIAAADGADDDHLALLSMLARSLVRPDFVAALRRARTPEAIVDLVTKAITPVGKATQTIDPAPTSTPPPGTTSNAATVTTGDLGAPLSPDTPVTTDPPSASSTPAPVVSDTPTPAHTPTPAPGEPPLAPVATPPVPPPAPSGQAPAPLEDEPTPEPGSAPLAKAHLLAVTSCPTGIAHTFMAADALEQAAERAGVDLHVEPQGSGSVTPIPEHLIAQADAVIFATDVGVRDRERFAGLPVVEAGVKQAIHEADRLIEQALDVAKDPQARTVETPGSQAGDSHMATSSPASSSGLSWPRRIQQAVMTGVSYMIPFIAAGGLLIALSFALGGYDITDNADFIVAENSLWNLPQEGLGTYLGAVAFQIGVAGMGFLVAALSGYTAYALAGRPGIAPGFIGGSISVSIGAGFIGGLVTGILAGLVSLWLSSFKVPRWLAGLMPVVIIPLISTTVTGGAMYLLLGNPLAQIVTSLNDWLTSMSGTSSAVVLGLILGLMMCFDLGGPVNKAAYLFATAGLSADTQASFEIMAAVMLAGMVPPLAMALSSTIRPSLYSPAERENGRSAWLLGASFISEGAIPFAAADPLRVIPSMMVGGAVTGALSMLLHVGSRAPHGGIFVLFAIDNVIGFFIALIAGIVASAAMVTVLKSIGNKPAAAPVEQPAVAPVHATA